MKTQVIQVSCDYPEKDAISYAAEMICSGKLVAFPTETVYGLGANALDSSAVSKIFAAKNRPADNPVIVHIASVKDLEKYTKNIPEVVWNLAKVFWPGPLTLLLEKKESIPSIVTAGSNLVSLRVPNHPVALALIQESQVPIAAPSANSSTKPSTTTAQHVLEDLDGKVDLILDAGPARIGLESTVLDVTSHPPAILRPGGLSFEEIQKILPDVVYYTSHDKKPRAPGMKYTHYAPKARVFVYVGNENSVIKKIQEDYTEGITEIISDVIIPEVPKHAQHIFLDNHMLAKNIFSLFRDADKKGITKILIKGVEERGLGVAVMNRIKKAATSIITV